ncbi:protein NO VEIN domain-containing protein [Nitrosomonas communis]|uniref:Protein NO VEIN C-terminal domain-containing protein n=1 Tax=Nitrosomonas communis TaxID=44574 RepID=A0A1I4RDB5_9PROT|nr:protein of unknown function [Nitrosomonas communis]
MRGGLVEDFYIEVKATTDNGGGNIYLSSGQLNFLEENNDNSALAVVICGNDREVYNVIYRTLQEIRKDFQFEPIKFRLEQRGA